LKIENSNEEFIKQNADLKTKLLLTESNLKNSRLERENQIKEFEEMQIQFKKINQKFKESTKENYELKSEISNNDAQIEKLSLELHKTKELMSKLTDVKNVLNQHFTENPDNNNR